MANLFPSSWHGQRRKTADADEKDDRQRELTRVIRASKRGPQPVSLAPVRRSSHDDEAKDATRAEANGARTDPSLRADKSAGSQTGRSEDRPHVKSTRGRAR